MVLCGLQKLSMVDFPGKIAATVFAGGCNLRCPFCHNALLVNRLDESPALPVEEVLDFLKKRRGLLDGVVLSGGEPLLHPGAADFLRAVRDLGFAVKLDTNGCFPAALERILAAGLVDYVAMDVKNSREKYGLTVGVPGLDLRPIERSIDLIRSSGVDYEFRTTVVRELHTAADVAAIGHWLDGARCYALQQFVDSGNLVAEEAGFTAHPPEALRAMADAVRPHFCQTVVRGID